MSSTTTIPTQQTPPLPPSTTDAAKLMLERLAQAAADMPSRENVLNTQSALGAHDSRVQSIGFVSSRLRNAMRQVPQLTAERDAVAVWISNLTKWRAEFEARLAEMPTTRADFSREQEIEYQSLTKSIDNIDHGVEFWNGRAAVAKALRQKIVENYAPSWTGSTDPWDCGHGSLAMSEEKLADLNRQLAEVEHMFASAMAQAQSLVQPTPLAE